MPSLTPKAGLACVLALYLALAAAYAAVTPFGSAPDETAHALYIEHLVQAKSFPVLRRERRDAYEFHQPPLYYVVASPVWAIASAASRPAATMAARAVSILVGAAGIWLIATLAATGWPGRRALALGAAGFAALLPMRLATAASVSNDTLAEAVFTAALLAMAVMLRRGPDVRRAAALGLCLGLGVLSKSSDIVLFPVALVALLLACREPAAASAPGERAEPTTRKANAASTVGARASSSRAPRPTAPDAPPPFDALLFWRCAAVTFGVALLVGGGWMLRNAHLYGDPLGTRAFEQYFQDTPTPDQMQQLLGYSGLELLMRKVLPLSFISFWGVFGHMEKFMGTYPRGASTPAWASVLADHGYPPASWLYPILLVVSLIAAAGLAWKAVQYWLFAPRAARSPTPNTQHRPPNAERLIAVLSLAAFLVLAAFLRFNTEFFQAQGRYLFPAMAPVSLGFTAGWLAWWPHRRRALAVLPLMAGMLALALYALFAVLLPAFH